MLSSSHRSQLYTPELHTLTLQVLGLGLLLCPLAPWGWGLAVLGKQKCSHATGEWWDLLQLRSQSSAVRVACLFCCHFTHPVLRSCSGLGTSPGIQQASPCGIRSFLPLQPPGLHHLSISSQCFLSKGFSKYVSLLDILVSLCGRSASWLRLVGHLVSASQPLQKLTTIRILS